MSEKKTIKKQSTSVHFRDAITGLYITKAYAEKNPKTTVKETDKTNK